MTSEITGCSGGQALQVATLSCAGGRTRRPFRCPFHAPFRAFSAAPNAEEETVLPQPDCGRWGAVWSEKKARRLARDCLHQSRAEGNHFGPTGKLEWLKWAKLGSNREARRDSERQKTRGNFGGGNLGEKKVFETIYQPPGRKELLSATVWLESALKVCAELCSFFSSLRESPKTPSNTHSLRPVPKAKAKWARN